MRRESILYSKALVKVLSGIILEYIGREDEFHRIEQI